MRWAAPGKLMTQAPYLAMVVPAGCFSGLISWPARTALRMLKAPPVPHLVPSPPQHTACNLGPICRDTPLRVEMWWRPPGPSACSGSPHHPVAAYLPANAFPPLLGPATSAAPLSPAEGPSTSFSRFSWATSPPAYPVV